jgi:predicted TIM-barrel fold metal-dependent hydrolase
VFEDFETYPLNTDRSYTPATATLEDYLRMCEIVGITRTVQVSASVYGADNSLTLAVIAKLGQERARGVAGVRPDVSPAEIKTLHRGGIRGVRVSTFVKGYGGTDTIPTIAPRIAPYGWHLQIHVHHAGELAALEPLLLRTPVPLVFDHLGCVRGAEGVGGAGFQALLRILRARDDCWAKISSWQRRSDLGPPTYDDMRQYVEALVIARPDRLLFGTNWPNPSVFAPELMPDDGDTVDQFCDWIPDAAIRHRILVENPAVLYGF